MNLKNDEPVLDFSPRGLLDIVSQSGRARVSGVTIDPAITRVIDDGISVRQQGKDWVIEVSIADVPAMIPDGSILEDMARNRYERKNSSGKEKGIFPRDLLIDYISLKEGEERPAITFSIVLNENLDVKTYNIARTMFLNTKKHSVESLQERAGRLLPWLELGERLYQKRASEFSKICNDLMPGEGKAEITSHSDPQIEPEDDRNLLIQESMRLANQVATDFMSRKGVAAPFRPLHGIVNVTRVTSRIAFDKAANKMAFDLIQKMEAHAKPSVRLTSPLRKFDHFIGLKSLAHHLDGNDLPPVLRQQSLGIVQKYNQYASGKKTHILSNQWASEWRVQMTEQGQDVIREIERRRGSSTRTLKSVCQEQKLGQPLISERTLQVDGFDATLVGISAGGTKGAEETQSWALHPDPEKALEIASWQMLQKFQR